MQKYTVDYLHLEPTPPPWRQAGDEEVYFASDVDARIAELEIAAQPRYSRRQMEARISELESTLRRIVSEVSGVGEHSTKEFHREGLFSVKCMALTALSTKS